EDQVRGGGAEYDQVELAGRDARGFQRTQGGVVGKVAGGLALGGDVALADAGARGDPFIAGIDELGQVVVGQHFFRQIAAGARDARIHALDRPRLVHLYNRPRPGALHASRHATRARRRALPAGPPSATAARLDQSSSTTTALGAITCLPR